MRRRRRRRKWEEEEKKRSCPFCFTVVTSFDIRMYGKCLLNGKVLPREVTWGVYHMAGKPPKPMGPLLLRHYRPSPGPPQPQ